MIDRKYSWTGDMAKNEVLLKLRKFKKIEPEVVQICPTVRPRFERG